MLTLLINNWFLVKYSGYLELAPLSGSKSYGRNFEYFGIL